jgi:TonB family protein
MTGFPLYLLKSGACAAILWGAYYLLLRRETRFVFTRIYLLSIIPLSIIIPLLQIPLWPAPEYIAETSLLPDYPAVDVPAFSPGQAVPYTPPFNTARMLLLPLYLAGMLFVFVRLVGQLVKAFRAVSTKPSPAKAPFMAFTFFRKIYINRERIATAEYNKILLHEQAHAQQLHTLDLLLAELFLAFQWFNPFAWLLKKSLAEVHEYLADAKVLAQGVDKNQYKQLLYNQSAGIYPEYASGFNYSLTKKRLIMMTKTKNKFFWPQLLGVLATLALLTGLFGCTQQKANEPDILLSVEIHPTDEATAEAMQWQDVLSVEDSDFPFQVIFRLHTHEILPFFVTDKTAYQEMIDFFTNSELQRTDIRTLDFYKHSKQSNRVPTINPKEYIRYALMEKKPAFKKGDETAFTKWVSQQLVYPEEWKEEALNGRVILQFIVGKDGTIGDVQIVQNAHPALDAEALRVIQKSPKWEQPGEYDGIVMSTKIQYPVSFQNGEAKGEQVIVKPTKNTAPRYHLTASSGPLRIEGLQESHVKKARLVITNQFGEEIYRCEDYKALPEDQLPSAASFEKAGNYYYNLVKSFKNKQAKETERGYISVSK